MWQTFYRRIVKIDAGDANMTFYEKLKILRAKKEYSQEQFVELLNVSRQAITKWKNRI